MQISCLDQPQILGEEENDPRTEFILKILNENSNDSLICLIHFLKSYFNEFVERNHHSFTCSIIILSKDFFNVDFW